MATLPRSRLAGALLALALGAPGVLAEDAPPTISRVLFRGNHTYEEPFLRLHLRSARGSPATTETLEADAAALRDTGLFREVRVRQDPRDEGRVRVVFELVEAPRLREVEVRGMTLVDPEPLRARAREEVLALPSRDALAGLREEAAALYTRAGVFAAGLRSQEPAALTSDGVLVLHAVEPRLAGVEIEGARRVRPRDIRRKLVLERGEVVRTAAMDASIRRVLGLGTVRSAHFEVAERSPEEDAVTLRLEVEEDPYTGELEYGVRYDRVNQAVLTLGLVRRNVLGSGMTFRLDTEQGGRESYAARLSSDWVLGLPVSGELGAHDTETRREVRRAGAVTSRLTEQRRGQAYRLSKVLHGSDQVLTLGLRDEEVRAVPRDGFPLPPNLVALGGDPGEARYPHQGLELAWTRGPPLNPLTREAPRGERLGVEMVGGPLFRGPADYTLVQGELRRLHTLGRHTAFAWRVRAGGIFLEEGVLPLLEQLTVGGSETLRGYQYKEFLGDRMLLANLELRRRLSPALEAVAFLDWGDAWEHGARGLDGQLGFGLGARVDVRLFELRVDVARGAGEPGLQWTLGVGHVF